MTTGRLHSVETLGAVDGPGIRTVFFFQGCPARCLYCHNPDTWSEIGGMTAAVEDIVRRAERGRPYYGTEGGVTFSGGEPLLQGEFLCEALQALRDAGIHTAVDTSGTYFDEWTERCIEQTDLVLLDIKHTDEDAFRELTGRNQSDLFQLIDVINRTETPVWIRQVIVPGMNDSEESVHALKRFTRQIQTVKKIELLGYHDLGKSKYEKMGVPYRLDGVPPMDKDRLRKLQELLDAAE